MNNPPSNNENNIEVCRTRLGRISRLYNYSKYFLEIIHLQKGISRYVTSYYYNEYDMVKKLN